MRGNRQKFDDPAAGAFGTALRQHRQRRALSQEDLSDRTRGGVAARTISDLERGVARRPRSETIRLLAEALGLAEEDLAAFKAAARGELPLAAAPVSAKAVAAELAVRHEALRRGATGPVIIVTDAARLAEVGQLLSATPDCLIVVTG